MTKPASDAQCDDCQWNWKFMGAPDANHHCYMFKDREDDCYKRRPSDARERGWLDSTAPGFVVSPVPSLTCNFCGAQWHGTKSVCECGAMIPEECHPTPKTAKRYGKTQTQALRGRWFVGQMRKVKQDETKKV